MTARRTKIVCTLGPATHSAGAIEALIQAGMDVARINFSHGTQQEHAQTIALVRAVAHRLDRSVAVLQDLQGPKIRTGPLVGGKPVLLRAGQRFTITTEPVSGTSERVSTTYAALSQDVKPGGTILLSDGAIELRVTAVQGTEVICDVMHGEQLAEHQGINLPGVAISAPALTEKDRNDLAFGVRAGVDYIALSFVRRPDDLREARRLIAEAQQASPAPSTGQPAGVSASITAGYASGHAPVPVIAKLEKPEAIEHLDAILAASDGVMVARGDLGVELPLEQVPMVQKRVIARANTLGLPVITATQMLESMIHSPRPTRAEASDVANAILDGTDAVMLSGETAVGAYPLEAVRVMARIACETEGHGSLAHPTHSGDAAPGDAPASLPHAVARAAHTLAEQARASLIVVFTRSGMSAQLISQERPNATIVAYTPVDTVYRRLALWWGVAPRRSQLLGSTEELIAWVDAELRREGLARTGEDVVIMGGMPLAGQAHTNFVKLHRVGEA